MPGRDDDHHLGWILARGPIVTGPCIKNVNFYGTSCVVMSLRINMDMMFGFFSHRLMQFLLL